MLWRHWRVAALVVAVVTTGSTPDMVFAQAPTTADLTVLALDAGKAGFGKVFLEDGGSYFTSYVTSGAGGFAAPLGYSGGVPVLIEAKDVKFRVYSSPLTRADLANGLEWRGRVSAETSLMRNYVENKGWEQWRDGLVTLFSVGYERNTGHWRTTDVLYIDGNATTLRLPRADQISSLRSAPVLPPPDLNCAPWLKREGRC